VGTLFGFVVGYILGARTGSERFDEVVEAFHEIRNPDEVRAFVGVVKRHGRGTAAIVSQRLAEGESTPSAAERVVAARHRAEHG
jgi:hypothetical protein